MKEPKQSRGILVRVGVCAVTPVSTFTVLTLCITVTGTKHPQGVYRARCPSRTEESDPGDGRRKDDTHPTLLARYSHFPVLLQQQSREVTQLDY